MPDFFAAARRHLNDGDFLHQHARHTNAVQLWAYGGECTLKAIALQQGHFQMDKNGKPNKGFGLHLNQIKEGSDLLSLYNAAQTGTSILMGPTTAFVDWNINERYEDGSKLLTKLDDYKRDASFFRNMLNNSARSEGL